MLYRVLIVLLFMNSAALYAQSSVESSESDFEFEDSDWELVEDSDSDFEFEDSDWEFVEDSDFEFEDLNMVEQSGSLLLNLSQERQCPVEALRRLYESVSSDFEYMDAIIIEREVLALCTETSSAYVRLINLESQLLQEWTKYQDSRREILELEEQELIVVEEPFEQQVETAVVETPVITFPSVNDNDQSEAKGEKKNPCPTPRPASLYHLRGTVAVGSDAYASFEEKYGSRSYTMNSGQKLPGDVEILSVSPTTGKAFLRDCAGNFIARM